VIGKIAKSGHLLSGEMRTEKENSDTVKVHFAKIIEKQKRTTWTFKTDLL